MSKDNFNKPLLLINKKPIGSHMIENGYAFYMYPDLVVVYANKVLKDAERRLYFAISGQAEKDKTGKPYHWAMSHYCQIADIKSNHYAEYLTGLHDKGFIIHNNFESIEVLYPISENELISPNGKIESRESFFTRRKTEKQINLENVQDSQKGKNAQDFISLRREDESQKWNQEDNLGNCDSPNCANNREININKELIENPQELEYAEKALNLVRQIGKKFNIENRVLQQLDSIKKQGFSNEFIFYALENKRVEDFSMGLGLLFYKPYQEEIKAILQDKRALKEKQEIILKSIEENKELLIPKTRLVRAQKREKPSFLTQRPNIKYWEEFEEKPKTNLAEYL